MKTFHIQVITGHGSPQYVGLAHYTVEADDFHVDCNSYKFYKMNGEEREWVAFYPVNRTIITKIEEV